MIRPLNSKDKTNFLFYCSYPDRFKDFYITQNNERLFLSNIYVAEKVFNECLKWGNKCLIYDENDIQGILLLIGYSDNSERKYLKLFAKNKTVADSLLKHFLKQHNSEIYWKLKKDNWLLNLVQKKNFYKYGFEFVDYKGQEILLKNNCKSDYKTFYSTKD